MANFSKAILTSKGQQLQAKVQSGIQLNFTKMALGNGNVGDTPISTLTDLVSKKVEITITSGKLKNNTYTVGALFSNSSLQTGFWWKEFGVYAQDPDEGEILYCYSTAGDAGDYIPVASSQRIEKYIYTSIGVGNATNVTISVSQSDTYVTVTDFNTEMATKADLGADGKVLSTQLPEINLSAGNITITDAAGNFTSTNVEDALGELSRDKSNINHNHPDKLDTNGNGSNVTVAFVEAVTDADIASGESNATLFGKIKKRFSVIASNLANLSNLLSEHRNSTIVHVTASDKTLWNGKAPASHANADGSNGLGTKVKYGHVTLYEGLDRAVYVDGEALPSNIGKLLNDKIDKNPYSLTLLKTITLPTTINSNSSIELLAPFSELYEEIVVIIEGSLKFNKNSASNASFAINLSSAPSSFKVSIASISGTEYTANLKVKERYMPLSYNVSGDNVYTEYFSRYWGNNLVFKNTEGLKLNYQLQNGATITNVNVAVKIYAR